MSTPHKNRLREWNISIDRRNLSRERSTKMGKMTVTYPEENEYPRRHETVPRYVLFYSGEVFPTGRNFLSRPDGWLSKRQLYRGKNHAVRRNKVEEKEKERWRKEETGHGRDEKRRGKGRRETQLDATSARESKLCVTGKHNGRESSNNAQRLSYNTPGATCGL